MSASDSYIIQDALPEQDEIDSLPSSVASSEVDSEEESDAQKEWEASLQQLELILTMMIVPYAGKYFGRRFAYWSKFDTHPDEFVPTRINVLIMCLLQVGQSTWSGCILWRSDLRIKGPLDWLVLWRLLRPCDEVWRRVQKTRYIPLIWNCCRQSCELENGVKKGLPEICIESCCENAHMLLSRSTFSV
jgi:hypothetical protein